MNLRSKHLFTSANPLFYFCLTAATLLLPVGRSIARPCASFVAPLYGGEAFQSSGTDENASGDNANQGEATKGDNADPRGRAQGDDSSGVTIGLDGKWKLGHDLQVVVRTPANSSVTTLQVQSVDGDGVPVRYEQSVAPGSGGETVSAIVRVGREQQDLSVRLLGGEEVLLEEAVSLEGDRSGYPSDQIFVAAIGDAMGVGSLSGTQSGRGRTSVAVAELKSATTAPVDWRGYASCDLVVVSCDDLSLLGEFATEQWQALDDWVRRGGHCVITLGVEGEQLPEELVGWLPAEPGEVVRINDPGTIEALVSTDAPLGAIRATKLDGAIGRVELSVTDTLGRDSPWWTHYPRGHGIVHVVASSLSSEAFAAWEDRQLLWQRVVRDVIDLERNKEQEAGSVGDASYLGYNDLVGQLRATLDVFPSIRVLAFSQLAALLIAVLVIVGPVDYFISVKWLNRPQVSWYLTGGFLIATCIALSFVYQAIRPDEIWVNSAQIVDYDSATGRIGGRMWTHVYSGAAGVMDIDVAVSEELGGAPVRVDWQALPGRGLGGIGSQLSADSGMPEYAVQVDSDGDSKIVGAGVSAAGTKSLFATWNAQLEPNTDSVLAEAGGVNQLTGQVANPLDVELLEPALFYHNWHYALGSRIPASGIASVSYDAIPKDITRRLNRRRIIEDSDVSTPWDPADRGNLDRLLELMMFYKAGSGPAYTSLRHRYHNAIDQSNLMNTNVAVLIGRVEKSFADAVVRSNRDVPVQQGVRSVWVRVLIPVQPAEK